MRPRTVQNIKSIGLLLIVIGIVYFVLMMISGCSPKPAAPPPPPVPSTTSGLTDAAAGFLEAATPSDPTEAAATQSLWPFTWVGALCLLAGVVWLIMFKQPLILIIGGVLAAVPFVVLYTSKAFLIHQPMGQGQLVAFAEDPNYHAYTEATQLLFMNAVLLGPGR